MKSKRRILLVALLAPLLAGVIWLALRSREPRYQGRALTYLLENNPHRQLYQTNTQQFLASLGSDPAIRQIGTNAIPTLLRLMRAYDSPLKLKFIKLVQKQSILKIHFVTASERHLQAWVGFQSLGADARFAVPGLIDVLQHARDDESRSVAMIELREIGPPAKPAVPALLDFLNTTPGRKLQHAVVNTIRAIDPETAALRKNEFEALLGNPKPNSDPFTMWNNQSEISP